MDAINIQRVLLPDGKTVQISDIEQAWWTCDGSSGYMNPKMLAPDPNQPREHMDEAELAELTESIKERGVRDPVTVTPRKLSPWVTLAPEHEDLPFVIVAGHRRTAGSLRAPVEAIPIRVVVYPCEADYLLDASILNNNRASLTPLEEGREIVRLRDKGVTLAKIAKSLGRSITHVMRRISLTRIAPELQPLLNPALPVKKRLALLIAEELGAVDIPTTEELEEFLVLYKTDITSAPLVGKMRATFHVDDLDDDARRFHLQKILLSVILRRSLNVARAVAFIQEQKLQLAVARGGRGPETERFQPRRRKEILMNLAGEVRGNTVIDWTPQELRRIFETADWAEVEQFRSAIHEAAQNLADIEKLIKRIADEKIIAMRTAE